VTTGAAGIAAIPELLRVLELKGALVTLGAAGCQKEIARQVRDGGGDYLPVVRGNQPTLYDTVFSAFDRACGADFAGVKHDEAGPIDDAPGRHEGRYVTVIYDPEGLPAKAAVVAAILLAFLAGHADCGWVGSGRSASAAPDGAGRIAEVSSAWPGKASGRAEEVWATSPRPGRRPAGDTERERGVR
jgi:hypothetical protein